MIVQFIILGDRWNLPRNEVEKHLEPLKQELIRLGITPLSIIRVVAAIICNAPKDAFEQIFSTQVEGTDISNWKLVKPISIPSSLKQFGAVSITLDQQRMVTQGE
jgi:hypothetical protein